MPETRIEFSEVVGRRIRLGSWEDQKISTYKKIAESIEAGDWDSAAIWADYFTDEANVCFSLYRQWINDLRGFLRDSGVSATEVEPSTPTCSPNSPAPTDARGTPTVIGISIAPSSASCWPASIGKSPRTR